MGICVAIVYYIHDIALAWAAAVVGGRASLARRFLTLFSSKRRRRLVIIYLHGFSMTSCRWYLVRTLHLHGLKLSMLNSLSHWLSSARYSPRVRLLEQSLFLPPRFGPAVWLGWLHVMANMTFFKLSDDSVAHLRLIGLNISLLVTIKSTTFRFVIIPSFGQIIFTSSNITIDSRSTCAH